MKNLDRFKVKIWDKDNKRWHGDYPVMDLAYSLQCNRFMYDNDHFDAPENFEIVQCTGLRDKNEKLFFEGDIIRIRTFYHLIVGDDSPIKEDEGYAFYVLRFNDFIKSENFLQFIFVCEFFTKMKPNCKYLTAKSHFEIIGNIYENPELINL